MDKCNTYGKPKPDVKVRIDNGLISGTHCDDCWYKMVLECWSWSW